MRLQALIAFAALAFSAAAAVVPEPAGRAAALAVQAATPEQFAASAERLRDALKPGGRYARVRDCDKWRIESRLSQIEILFARYGAIESMSEDQRRQLFGHRDDVNNLLRQHDARRPACEVHPTIACAFR
jgi:hypothetical protein